MHLASYNVIINETFSPSPPSFVIVDTTWKRLNHEREQACSINFTRECSGHFYGKQPHFCYNSCKSEAYVPSWVFETENSLYTLNTQHQLVDSINREIPWYWRATLQISKQYNIVFVRSFLWLTHSASVWKSVADSLVICTTAELVLYFMSWLREYWG